MSKVRREVDALPHNAEAEQSVLGAVLLNPTLFPKAAAILSPLDFYKTSNEKIFVEMVRLVEVGVAIDPVTLKESLASCGELDAVGGPAYISSLTDGVPHSGNVEYYACIVKEKARDRIALRAAQAFAEAVVGRNGAGPGEARVPVNSAAAVLQEAIQNLGHPSRIVPATTQEVLAAAARAVDWVVAPLFTAKGVRILSGLGKTGKSTLAIALGISAIEGAELAGAFHGQGGHSVAFLDAENRLEVWARKLVSICQGLKVDPARLLQTGRLLYLHPRALFLDDPATLRAVIDTLKRAVITEVVIDSLTAVHQKDESRAGQMRGFFQEAIFRIRDEVGAGITILHHHRKPPPGADDPSQALRGSSDLRNVVDTHIAMSRGVKDRNVLRLDVNGQRESEEAGPFYIRTDWAENGSLTLSSVQPGDAALPKVESAKDEVMALIEGTPEGEIGRRSIVTTLRERGYVERTINDALTALISTPGARLKKARRGMEMIYGLAE